MSAVSWLRRPSALLVAATSLYSVTVWTQTRPAPAPTTHDRTEAAHEGLRGDDKARDTARLTAAVARPVDPAAASRPVPRRTSSTRSSSTASPRPRCRTRRSRRRSSCAALPRRHRPAAVVRGRACLRGGSRDNKRDRLIDRLLASDEFAEQWAGTGATCCACRAKPGQRQCLPHWFKELPGRSALRPLRARRLVPSSKVHATIPSLAVIGRSNQLKSRFVEAWTTTASRTASTTSTPSRST
jgi:hypothetical protein